MSTNYKMKYMCFSMAFTICALFSSYAWPQLSQDNAQDNAIAEFKKIEKILGSDEKNIKMTCANFLDNKELIKSILSDNNMASKAYNTIGWCNYNLKNIKEAIANLESALQSLGDPADPELEIKINNNLGIIYYSIGDINKSTEYFSITEKKGSLLAKDYISSIEGLKRQSQANDYIKIGISYRLNRQFDEAINYYTKAIDLDPENARAYQYRGYSFFRLEKYDQALEDLLKSQQLDQSRIEVHVNIVKVYCKLNSDMAVNYLKELPGTIDIKSDYVRSDGELYSACGKHKDVMNLLPPQK